MLLGNTNRISLRHQFPAFVFFASPPSPDILVHFYIWAHSSLRPVTQSMAPSATPASFSCSSSPPPSLHPLPISHPHQLPSTPVTIAKSCSCSGAILPFLSSNVFLSLTHELTAISLSVISKWLCQIITCIIGKIYVLAFFDETRLLIFFSYSY